MDLAPPVADLGFSVKWLQTKIAL